MAIAKQLTVMVDNKRGTLAEMCSKLAEKAVNILGLMVPDKKGVARVRFVVNNAEAARKIFDGLGLKYTQEDVISVRVSDRPGALGKITRKLADNDIDIWYAYGSILKGAGTANIILAVSDVAAANRIMK